MFHYIKNFQKNFELSSFNFFFVKFKAEIGIPT